MKITKLISAIIIITVAFSRGATFNVTDVSSFQAALTTAGANGEADIINVAAGIYNIATPLSYGENIRSVLLAQEQIQQFLTAAAQCRL